MEQQHLVFVYGTLRQNHGNHHFLQDAFCYGVGCTQDKYAMYAMRGYPYVISTETRYPITGELYAVDDKTLKKLDNMEGHPSYYERKQVKVNIDGKEYTAWMYFRDPIGTLMHTGDYNDAKLSR